MNRKRFLCFIRFVLIISTSFLAFSAVAGILESDSGTLPPDILPVIIVQGSDYDMGYQYIQQVAEVFDLSFLERMQKPEFTDEEILALKAYQNYIKKRVPEYIDQFRGIADGATALGVELSYREVIAHMVGAMGGVRSYPGTEPSGSKSDTLPPRCSEWAAWGDSTADGRLIAANSLDWTYGHFEILVAFPEKGNNYMLMGGGGPTQSLTSMGWSCMNNKGVWIGRSSGVAVRPEDYGKSGYHSVIGVTQHIMRYCDTAAKAKDMRLEFGEDITWNKLIADTNNDAYVLEMSGVLKEIRRPGDFGEGDFIYATNNYFTNKGGEANLGNLPGRFTKHGGWSQDPPPGVEGIGGSGDWQLSAVARNLTIYNMLNSYQGKIDLDFAKMLWRFNGDVPENPDSVLDFRTTRAKKWNALNNMSNCEVAVALPDNGDKGQMNICTGPAGRIVYPAHPYVPGSALGFLPRINGTHSFYELTLGSDAAGLVDAAKNAAVASIHKAHLKLMFLNYGDPGFEGLNGLFNQASTELYEGINWMNKARSTGSNDAMLYYGKAAISFTRSQAHANQLYNALVPPAETPQDLGLHAYTLNK